MKSQEIKEQLIEYETAKLATEKGFNSFDPNNNRVFCESLESVFYHKPVQNDHGNSFNADYLYRCPTQSLLQTWLRDVHKIEIAVQWFDTCYIKSVKQKPFKANTYRVEGVQTYEQALEEALIEGLNLLP